MEIVLEVNCSNCDAEIQHVSLHLSDDEIPIINVTEFAQTQWICLECFTVNCIGDIDVVDVEDL